MKGTGVNPLHVSAACRSFTYKLEAAADRRLDVGAAEGGDLAELPGDLDGVVQEEAEATLVAETCRAGNLSEQDWSTPGGRGDIERVTKGKTTGRIRVAHFLDFPSPIVEQLNKR